MILIAELKSHIKRESKLGQQSIDFIDCKFIK